MRHLLSNNHDDAIHYINSLQKTSKTDEVKETYWFPTLQNPGNEKEHTPIQTRIRNELRELEQLEKVNSLENTDSRNQFLSNFDWTDSIYNRMPNKPLKTCLWNSMTSLLDTVSTSESIQNSKYNSHQ